MAKRHGPTDAGRYKRAVPSGRHPRATDKPETKKKLRKDPRKIDRAHGETLWTPELQATIVQYIQAGNYAEVAARAAGVHKATFYNWLTRGGRGEEPFKALVDAIEEATARSQMIDVMQIGKASTGGAWQAAAWRLERKFPKKWGRSDRLEISNDSDAVVQDRASRMDPARLTPAERALLKELREKMRVNIEPVEDDVDVKPGKRKDDE